MTAENPSNVVENNQDTSPRSSVNLKQEKYEKNKT